MSCSCCKTNTKKQRKDCPQCEQTCFPVSKQTLLHQVQSPENQHLDDEDYVYCPNRDCSVGYFSAKNIIPKAHFRAFQANQESMLCHCFDISEAAYRTALNENSAEAMKDFVVQQTQAKLCACESRNPSGRCCLVAFKQMEKNIVNFQFSQKGSS